MRRRILFVWFVILIAFPWKLYSQQAISLSNYLNTVSLYNPAYAGAKENISTTFLYKNQWNKLPNSPSAQMLSIHAPILHKSIGIGGNAGSEQLGPLKIFNLSALYAYRINFGSGVLSFGLQGGIKQYRLSASLLDPKDVADGSLPVSDASFILPDAGAGLYYNSQRFQLSLSAMQLIGKRISNPSIALSRGYYLSTSYLFNKKGYINILPAVFLKYNTGSQFQGEMSLYAKSPEITMGISYKTVRVISFQIALHLNKLLPALQEDITFGYGYDHYTSTTAFGNGGNEFFLQYNFKLNPTVRKVSKQPKSHAPKFF